MAISFSSQDDYTDYYNSVGYHLIGVYTSVIENPTLYCRYFVSPYNKGRELTPSTKVEDVVYFDIHDIVEDSVCTIPDTDEFKKYIGDLEIIERKNL